MARAPTPKRGEIWLVNFDPAVGSEIQKTRPAVVVSMDGTGRLPLRVVVPLTDWKPAYANYSWFVLVPASPRTGLSKDSGADAFQVKSLSENRFVHDLGTLNNDELDNVATAVAVVVGKP